MDAHFRMGTSKLYSLITDNFVATDLKSKFEICFAGNSDFKHSIQLTYPGGSLDTSYFGYTKLLLTLETAAALDSVSTFKATIPSNAELAADNTCFAYINALYTRDLNVTSLTKFSFKNNTTSIADKLFYNFTGFADGILYDISNNLRSELLPNGKNSRCLIDYNGTSANFFVAPLSEIKKPLYIKPIKSKNSVQEARFFDFSQSINQGNYLIITHQSLWSKAIEYQAYRASTGYNAVLVDVDELYNQFGFGLFKHPGGIRYFLQFALETWNQKPEYLFLLGKGIQLNSLKGSSVNFAKCLVPTFGYPSSDMLFSSALLSSDYQPAIATGRYSAKTESEVDVYLSKIKEYEQNTPAEWMKHILHFGGGGSFYEQQTFKNYLKKYQTSMEGRDFAGTVHTFLKATSDPIEITKSDYIRQLVNTGCSMMTFFGHASGEGFDQNVDHPSVFSNKGKYPFILANSCFSGDMYEPTNSSISETWMLTKDRGAIGFLAGVAQGYDYYLDRFSEELVRNLALYSYGSSIGKAIQKTTGNLYLRYGNEQNTKFGALNFAFHGDPATKLNYFLLPDLSVSLNDLKINPQQVTTDIDSLTVSLTIKNIGKAIADTFVVSVKHIFSNGNFVSKVDTLFECNYSDTLIYRFAVGSALSGINKISVMLDADKEIEELQEINNSIDYEFLISSSDIIPVYPYNFAIIPEPQTILKASLADPISDVKNCIIELDTSYLLNSNFKKTIILPVNESIIEWNPELVLTENTVYYWRVAALDENNNPKNWNKSSFTYIKDITGWSQAAFPQFLDNSYQYIKPDTLQNDYRFIETPKQIFLSTIGSTAGESQFAQVRFLIDGTVKAWSTCLDIAAVNIAVIDPVTFELWKSNKANFGHRNYPICTSVNDFYAFTSNNATALTGMASMLTDSVPDGHYIVAYTFKYGYFDSWPEKTLAAFEQLGATNIRNVPNLNPYLFFVQKGSPEKAREVIGINTNSYIEMYENVPANYFTGSITSAIVGPFSKYNSLIWNTIDKDTSDYSQLSIFGINTAGSEVLLYQTSVQNTINELDTLIDAKIYPSLRLVFNTTDELNKTPSKPVKWQIYADEVPETAIITANYFSFHNDTIAQGDELILKVSTKNIGSKNMDSLYVQYSINDESNNTIYTEYKLLNNIHLTNSIETDTLVFNTSKLTGKNTLKVEFNPINSETGSYFQTEKYHFNNILIKSFSVMPDKRNPLLDVTFDGIHIIDGELVSAKPLIRILTKDDNLFFKMNDTSLYDITLTDPQGNEKKIYFAQNADWYSIKIDSSQISKNKCLVEFIPILSQDGIYSLSVMIYDKSGNASGSEYYTITFEVINETSISQIVNYPNPFKTATNFLFTLTGSQLPNDFRIQIFSLTGIMVKEIDLLQNANVHIGKNTNTCTWYGDDNFGNRLAEGVYFYKVIASIYNENSNQIPVVYDKNFVNGYGKMILIK
ncbi:MAG: hypothetical protein IPO21_00435 [Bacteroidales bacterium]|nr:hypothetical protein [Bacteroidales bacterium]